MLFVLCLALSACSADVETKSLSPCQLNTHAYGSGELNKNCLLVFRSRDGQLVYRMDEDTEEVEMPILGNGLFRIYSLMDIEKPWDDVAVEAELNTKLRWTGYSIHNGLLPFAGRMEKRCLDSDFVLDIPMTRLAAKYSFTLDKSRMVNGTLTVTSLEFFNCKESYNPYYDRTEDLSGCETPFYSAGSTEIQRLNSGKSVNFYIPENLQGIESGIGKSDDKSPDYNYRLVDIDSCTYAEVKCNYAGNGQIVKVTYRMYLGENPTSSFNIKRNTSYTISLIPDESRLGENRWKCETSSIIDK